MQLLLLGGTAFVGRAVAREALARGHAVTCLARGSAAPVDGVEFVAADRDADDGLAVVAGRDWDAVIDLTRHPVHARRAVRDVRARHRVYVSTTSVYARDVREQDESGEVVPASTGDMLTDLAEYGAAKVACEQAYRDGWSEGTSCTIVRPGLIGGTGDWSGRTGYYAWRFAHPTGPDVLVPPDLTFPVAVIDVVDLAHWIVVCAEDRIDGTYNAVGATTTLGEYLDVARRAAGSDLPARPVPREVLADAGVGGWAGPRSLPLWVDDPDARWFATADSGAALRRGLTRRPLEDTMADVVAYEEVRERDRAAGLGDDEERDLRSRLGRG